jgi:hypothetical protein
MEAKESIKEFGNAVRRKTRRDYDVLLGDLFLVLGFIVACVGVDLDSLLGVLLGFIVAVIAMCVRIPACDPLFLFMAIEERIYVAEKMAKAEKLAQANNSDAYRAYKKGKLFYYEEKGKTREIFSRTEILLLLACGSGERVESGYLFHADDVVVGRLD